MKKQKYVWDVGVFDLFIVSASVLCGYLPTYQYGRESKNWNKPENVFCSRHCTSQSPSQKLVSPVNAKNRA